MNNIYFIDTNIIISHLTNDDQKKSKKCFSLLQKVEKGEVIITTCEAVITEVIYILSSKTLYNLSRKKIQEIMHPILTLKGFKLPYRKIYLQALEFYTQYKIDFEDALIKAHMKDKNLKSLYSYDQDFDQIKTIKRIEP